MIYVLIGIVSLAAYLALVLSVNFLADQVERLPRVLELRRQRARTKAFEKELQRQKDNADSQLLNHLPPSQAAHVRDRLALQHALVEYGHPEWIHCPNSVSASAVSVSKERAA